MTALLLNSSDQFFNLRMMESCNTKFMNESTLILVFSWNKHENPSFDLYMLVVITSCCKAFNAILLYSGIQANEAINPIIPIIEIRFERRSLRKIMLRGACSQR